MTTCQARSTQDGYRCDRCRVSWDRDDSAPPCPIESPPLQPMLISDQMIERAAEAICLWDGGLWSGALGSRDVSRDRYRNQARAALTAALQPEPPATRPRYVSALAPRRV